MATSEEKNQESSEKGSDISTDINDIDLSSIDNISFDDINSDIPKDIVEKKVPYKRVITEEQIDNVHRVGNITGAKKLANVDREDLPYINPIEKDHRIKLVNDLISLIETRDIKPLDDKIDELNKSILKWKKYTDRVLQFRYKKIDKINKEKQIFVKQINEIKKKSENTI